MIKIGVNQKDRLVIQFPYSKELVEIVHLLPSRQFIKKTSLWEVPLIDLPIVRDVFEKYKKEHKIKIELSEAAKARYFDLLNKYKHLTSIAEQTDVEYDSGLKPEVKLYPFQRVGAKFLEEAKRGLLAMDMGLGKTIVSLSATSNLIKKQKVKKPLIICPASLKFNWAIEIAKFSDFSYTVVGGEAKNRQNLYVNDSDFTIMNYDLLRLDIDTIKNIEWDLIIADEIQRAKNYSTAISKNIRRLQPEYIFGLTGTPIENDIMDLFTIMRFINSEMLGGNGLYFKERYCEVDGFGKILDYKEDTAHEVDRKTSFFMMRRKKRDVLDELPEKTTNFYYIDLNAEERKVYNQYKKKVSDDLHGGNAADALTQIVYLREICDCINLVAPQTKIISSKLEELKNILAELPPEAKVVIFTEYERMAKIIENNIPFKSVHLHGGVKNECRLEKELEKQVRAENGDLKGKDLDLKIHAQKLIAVCKNCPYYNDEMACASRKKIISKFNDDPSVRIFISTNAGKEGLNLQVANYVINYDMSFNPAVNEQRIARIDRIGQMSDHIFIINLVCSKTIEENILKTLEEKQQLFNRVIDKTERDTLKRFGAADLIDLL